MASGSRRQKLLDHAGDEAALEANPNPIAVVVLAHLKTLRNAHDDEARRMAQVRLVKGLYGRGYTAEQVRQLYRLMERMMTLPRQIQDADLLQHVLASIEQAGTPDAVRQVWAKR